jgi:hypothetical protein
MTNEEKNNILNQHKELYNGFATNNITPNQQPLYTQDFANDKNGITVNNKGSVTTYKNMNINEDVMSGSEFEPEETFESEYVSLGEKLDMIGDGPLDLPNGTVDIDDETLFTGEPDADDFDLDKIDSMVDNYMDNEDQDFDLDKIDSMVDNYMDNEDQDFDLDDMFFGDNFDDNDKTHITHNIQESLDMFKRLKKYN